MENSDFKNIKIPVHTVERGQDIVHKFKELQSFDTFAKYPHANRNIVIRYVVFCYDPESPFVKNASFDLIKRKEAAAEYAGFVRDKKTGVFNEEALDIINMKNEEVSAMIFCYLKLLNDLVWVQITTDEQLFWEYTTILNKTLEGADEKKLMEAANIKGKLREERNKIKIDLDKYYKEFFGDNQDLQEIVKRISPETISNHVKKAS